MYEFEIKYVKPLSVNCKLSRGKGKRFFINKEFKKYEEDVLLLMPKAKEQIKGSFGISFSFYLPNANQVDLDNLLKPLIDLCGKKGYFKNDNKCYILEAQKFYSRDYLIKIKIFEI